MKKYIVEFIGTFFLVLTIVLAVNNGTPPGFAPIAIGSVLMVMIYAGGHISGAHFNPAVTLGVCLRGKCDWSDAPGYVIAQLVGGALAAIVAGLLFGMSGMPGPTGPAATVAFAPACLAEFLGTFALVWVILHTATTKSNAGNSHYGLAIGFTVTACAYALGPFSGGAFNPAVATGVSIANMSAWSNMGALLVGELAAGALAAVLFGVVYGNED